MVDGSWLKAQGSWLMAKGGGPGLGGARRAWPGPAGSPSVERGGLVSPSSFVSPRRGAGAGVGVGILRGVGDSLDHQNIIISFKFSKVQVFTFSKFRKSFHVFLKILIP